MADTTLNGRSLFALAELIEQADFPLADYLPTSTIAAVFSSLYYTDAAILDSGDNVVIDLVLVFDGELVLAPPGCDAFSLVFAPGGQGLASVHCEILLGPDYSIAMREAAIALRVSEKVLRDAATSGPAEIFISGDITFSPDGIVVDRYKGGALAPAYLCGTQIQVEAEGVLPVFGEAGRPIYVTPDFSGLAIDSLTVRIPAETLKLDGGGTLEFEMLESAIGTTGFSGTVNVSWDSNGTDLQPSGSLLGFPFRFLSFGLDIDQNAILSASLLLEVRVEALETGAQAKWLGLEVAFGAEGSFSATFTATADFEFAEVLTLTATQMRLEESGGVWSFFLSGSARALLPGAEWPAIAFQDLGVSSAGEIILPDGGGIALSQPVSVTWYFVRLTLTKFRFGRPKGSTTKLQLALSAEIVLLEGLPAGASVDGLVAEWDPAVAAPPDIRFDGIGFSFGVPASFSASLSASYHNEAGDAVFRGRGSMAIPALDMEISVCVVVGQDTVAGFPYLYLFADAKLLPTGIPIAQTGLSIYGFQGLLAYNMALAIDMDAPADKRYYKLFSRPPIGITDLTKWEKRQGKNALGFGIVIGTMDRGFCLHAKGLIVIAFPDLTILLQSQADFLKIKPELGTTEEGSLESLMVYASGDPSLSLDVTANWSLAPAYAVEGQARAFFAFEDMSAWYVELGQDKDGKRITAEAVQWGGEWLFTAGFWLRIDAAGFVTGAQVDLDLHAESGGFFVDVGGYCRGAMGIHWEPLQWEGMLAMSVRMGAGYKGVTISVALSGTARARMSRPFDVLVSVEACIHALFWDICRGFDFAWQQLDPPVLTSALRDASATPRDWTVYETTTGDTASLETGVVSLDISGAQQPTIQPHSFLSLNFGKPMIDDTGLFNEAVALADSGYVTIGAGSGYSAAYHLKSLTLIRDPDGAAEPFTLWGTWEQDTLEPNRVLNLFSSERFGDDGSLTTSYVSSITIDYCDQPEDTLVCVPLDGVSPGYGILPEGSLYRWTRGVPQAPREFLGTGIVLGAGDKLQFDIRTDVDQITVKASSLPGWVPATQDFVIDKNSAGLFDASIYNWRLLSLCYLQGHHAQAWSVTTRSGGLLTGSEAWTVGDDALVLPPNETFELRVAHSASLKDPKGHVTTPIDATTVMRFHTSGPPGYRGALESYISSLYPKAGARPVYTGYDLAVTFVDEYVRLLYTSAGTRLVYRLYDAKGRLVTDGTGGLSLAPVVASGPMTQPASMQYWQAVYEENAVKDCVPDITFETTSENVLRLDAGLALSPNSQYVAQVVEEETPDVPLVEWGFATSRYALFTDLVQTEAEIAAPVTTAAALTGTSFDALVRQCGMATIDYAEHFKLTPILAAGGTACVALLLEAPEPLEFGTRLSVKVAGTRTIAYANADSTRGFVLRANGGTWPLKTVRVELTWLRDAGAGVLKLTVRGDSSAEFVALKVNLKGAR